MTTSRGRMPLTARLASGFATGALITSGLTIAAPAHAAVGVLPNLEAVPNGWSTTAIDVTWADGRYAWELGDAGAGIVWYEVTVTDASDQEVAWDSTQNQAVFVDALTPGGTYDVTVDALDEEGVVTASGTTTVTTHPRYVGAPTGVTVQGSLTVGSQLTAVTSGGVWEEGATTVYEWFGALPDAQSSGPVIATGPTLTLTPAHLDMTIWVGVTGTKDGVATVGVTSPFNPVRVANPAPKTLTTAIPTVTGKAKVGKRLTAMAGAWTAGTQLAYQWTANGEPITGATGSTLTLAKSLAGRRIAVVVTGSLSGYQNAVVSSASTGKVAADPKGTGSKGQKGEKKNRGKKGKGKGKS